MRLIGSVPVLETTDLGVFKILASEKDLAVIGQPASRRPGRSVIGLAAADLSPDRESLNFQLNDASLLNLGDVDECLAILLKTTAGEVPATPKPTPERRQPSRVEAGRSGDAAFITACRSEKLPEPVIKLAQDFLVAVRGFSKDELREGLHRKWVTYPRNFLAITIQNRNQQYCIHVKKTAMLSGLSDRLDIRDDRPGYVRFWLTEPSQLSAAVSAAKASFGLQGRRFLGV